MGVDDDICPDGNLNSCGDETTSLETVKSRCQGMSTCTFTASNANFGGDPCNGIGKYLRANFQCKDQDPPSIVCPSNVNFYITNDESFASRPFPTNYNASDNSGSYDVMIYDTYPLGSVFQGPFTPGSLYNFSVSASPYTWYYVVSDAAGNEDNCTIQINAVLVDQDPPSIVCPSNVNFYINNDESFASQPFPTNYNASDNSGSYDVVIYDTYPLGSVFQGPFTPGSLYNFSVSASPYTWYYVVSDAAGNEDNCTIQINAVLVDQDPPSIVCPSNVNFYINNDESFASQPFPTNYNASDNSGSYDVMIYDTYPLGSVFQGPFTPGSLYNFSVSASPYTWYYVVSDAAGNEENCTIQINAVLVDQDPPSIVCPSNVNFYITNDESFASQPFPTNYNASDNSGSYDVMIYDTYPLGSVFQGPFTPGSLYSFSVSASPYTWYYVASDAAGNEDNCTIQINAVLVESTFSTNQPSSPYSTEVPQVSTESTIGESTFSTNQPSSPYSTEVPQVSTESAIGESTFSTNQPSSPYSTEVPQVSTESAIGESLSSTNQPFSTKLTEMPSSQSATTESSFSTNQPISTASTEMPQASSTELSLEDIRSTTHFSSSSEMSSRGFSTEPVTVGMEFSIQLRILDVDGEPAVFTTEHNDKNSLVFRALSAAVRIAILRSLQGSGRTSDVLEFEMTSVLNGSLVVNGVARFPLNSAVDSDIIRDVLHTNMMDNNGRVENSLLIDPLATVVTNPTEDCPAYHCQNNGSCEQQGSFPDYTYTCRCMEGLSSSLCEVSVSGEAGNGGVIAIVAIVGVLVLLVIFALVVACASLANQASKRNSRPSEYREQV
ncbi:hyalin-like [Patiria miniata]|uniref:Uncharacterized protein n=1 Tax=Patiria miniata TaxID=46514 RepID=A0A913ZN75_PATMI|nr:hyalin-like [Patiria miniata]